MAEWLLTIWFVIIPTDTMEVKEFSFTQSFDTLEQCTTQEGKFNSLDITMPGLEFYTEATCEPNPEYCTDDGCPDFMKPAFIFNKPHNTNNCASCHSQKIKTN